MNKELLEKFDDVLDAEAQRVMNEIVSKYENQVKVGKSFSQLVRSLVDEKFKYYTVDIEMRCYGLVPKTLEPDFKGEYALVTKREGAKNHLLSYANAKISDKNHTQAAKELADLLIEYCNKNPETILGLPEIVADNMDALFPEHNDSVDSRATVMFLESELKNKGYKITSLCPIRLINM